MTRPGDAESELQVCARMLRALAHRIRGDLSVITNDLAYIATMVDPAEVERSRARCNKISAGLAHIGTLGSCRDTKTALPFGQILKMFGISQVGAAATADTTVEASQGLVELAVLLLRELIGEADCSCEDQGHAGGMVVVLKSPVMSEFSERYESLGAFAAAQLGERFIVEAGIVDLIFRDHGWVVTVLYEDHRATVRLDLASMKR